ncbi:MAG: nitrilase family protein, partial [Prevotellaceae bacterium]|nr:nitrilase family protein [Prevotellaceae bacterium]
NCQYNGGTVLLDYIGNPIVTSEFGKEEAVIGKVNMSSLSDFRKKFPALQNADEFIMTHR